VHGVSTELTSGGYDAINIRDLRIDDVLRKRVTISVSGFYGSLDEEFEGLNAIIYDSLYKRTHWKNPTFLMVREGANFLYSRIKIVKNQSIAKADFVYLLREARHMGYAVGVDTIKWTSIDLDIRHVSDYTWIKRVGIYGLPKDIRFIYRYINPPSLMDPKTHAFVLLSSRGPIGVGKFEYPYWHKEEKENILDILGIGVEYGEVPDYGDEARNLVNDFEHADMMRLKHEEKLSNNKVSKAIHRAVETVNRHVRDHNKRLKTFGYCMRCKRAKSKYSETPA